ncbi:hypothetical protein C6499_00185 [Candidatus Poribacteria bacterium]|nr:MAG: hypothetical protein C6499_00185 [Candidatus Poribacteria bacterium]
MNFLSPTSLFLFGLAIPIIALYILRLRRRREPVSTLMFWEELFRERQTTSLFQRLKHLLSLLLQLLFLALLVFAIARPQFAFITKSARQLVLIIDQSASMNAIEEETEGLTRLASAKESALRTVDGLRFMDEMTVISSHTRPVIHIPFTNHQKSLREAIDAIQATDISTNLEPAYDLAYAIAQTKPNPEIIIFSDFQSISEGLLAKLNSKTEQDENAEKSDPEIKRRLIRMGAANDNVGITQFRVRKSLVNAFDYQTLLRVVNASETEKKFNVELYFNENLFDVRPYDLAPGESKSEIFSNFAFEGGKLKAVLDVQDALPTDNTAYATLPKRDLIPVLLVTAENPFLQKALAVDEQIKLTVLTPTEYETDVLPESANSQGKQPYQVVIFDRYSPSTLGDGNYMFIYPPAASSETANPELKFHIGGALETPIITDWERTHPILQHVHLENVQIGAAYQVTPPSTAQVLARSFESPVLFIDVTPNRKIVFAAINILESDLPLRIAFPVIIANTIQWFQQRSEIQEHHLRTGEVLKQRVESIDATIQPELKPETDSPPDTPKLAKITGPGDKTWEIPIERDELLFDQTQRVGFYELKISEALGSTTEEDVSPTASDPTEENSGTVWSVNLADEVESHIGTDPAVEDLLEASVTPGGAALLRYPPWVYLVFLAVGLSVVEWFLYQRRRID